MHLTNPFLPWAVQYRHSSKRRYMQFPGCLHKSHNTLRNFSSTRAALPCRNTAPSSTVYIFANKNLLDQYQSSIKVLQRDELPTTTSGSIPKLCKQEMETGSQSPISNLQFAISFFHGINLAKLWRSLQKWWWNPVSVPTISLHLEDAIGHVVFILSMQYTDVTANAAIIKLGGL
ncbi:hypothetical protein BofuT4_P070040.1 [Botrytis cinerea T4]|uniref:Uncharacterized protein n=1 Tax=Botryotinia fuckeliana (strain T4) TaxID=999810 RepID=G2XQ40_BOTF4|nr:hypothetical protein BofuT4_P070040.1 [Botrytis cinerea T4]